MSAADRLRRIEALLAEAEAEGSLAERAATLTNDELLRELARARAELVGPVRGAGAWREVGEDPAGAAREPGGAEPEAAVSIRRMTDEELHRELDRLRAKAARRWEPAPAPGEPETTRNSRESDERGAPEAPGTPEAPRRAHENLSANPAPDAAEAGAAPAGGPETTRNSRESDEPAGGEGEGAAAPPRRAHENLVAAPAAAEAGAAPEIAPRTGRDRPERAERPADGAEAGERPERPDAARFLAAAEALMERERRRLARLDEQDAQDERRDPPPGWTGSVAHGSAATPEFRRATGGG